LTADASVATNVPDTFAFVLEFLDDLEERETARLIYARALINQASTLLMIVKKRSILNYSAKPHSCQDVLNSAVSKLFQ